MGLISGIQLIQQLLNAIDPEVQIKSMAELWEEIAQFNSYFNAVSWGSIPAEGIPLKVGEIAKLPFQETENLKYKPLALLESS